jgi:carbon monoxide dehydrogenase subunit G
MVELRVSVDVDAPPQQVFDALTDWKRQGEWMPGTQVRVTKGTGTAVGDEIVARTALPGLRKIGFDDPMRITAWESPSPESMNGRCEMEHLGRVVRGGGVFVVEARGSGSTFTWVEWVDPPLGVVGQAALRVGRGPTQRMLHVALKRFARWVTVR